MKLGGETLVLRRMLQKFRSFQMMIDTLLRHALRITLLYGVQP